MIPRLRVRYGCDAVVIGAGPYGLAVAAHLRTRGVATRVFGEPMLFWRRNMPSGMKLRSPWGATDISDSAKAFCLDAYINEHGIARQEPLPIGAFIDYGAWFQSHAVSDLDHRLVKRIEQSDGRFLVVAEDDETIITKHVVVATGLARQQVRPAVFTGAPVEIVTHTSDHTNFDSFRGKRVAIVGRGQSACETAALLSEAGAHPEILCHGPIRWLGGGQFAPRPQAVLKKFSSILAAPSAVGPFPLNWCVEAPNLVALLPARLRASFNTASLKAGAAAWLRPRFGGVRVRAGVEVTEAASSGDGIELRFNEGAAAFDRVVLATGYKINIAKIGILAPELLAAIACRDGSPILSTGFESSVPGLHFVGASAVSSLGPLMRFIAGTEFAARSVARVIGRELGSSRAENRSPAYDLAS